MTPREEFAKAAMCGWMASYPPERPHPEGLAALHTIAVNAYAVADEMLAVGAEWKSETDRMHDRIERLRGLCKTAAGFLRDAGQDDQAEEIAALIGDMEPPFSAAA